MPGQRPEIGFGITCQRHGKNNCAKGWRTCQAALVELEFQLGDAMLAYFQDRNADMVIMIMFTGGGNFAGKFEDESGCGFETLVGNVHAKVLLQYPDFHSPTA